jgi:ABC-type phosphate/phosphonate transport system substrate-binding protein
MYDRPETEEANDRLWAGIVRALAARGIDAPAALDRSTDLWEMWTSPELVLSQTCGLPYRSRLHGQVTLVATPVCDLPGAPPGHYYSVLVARRTDPRRSLADFDGATLAYNSADSQSGWAAPAAAADAVGISFGAGVATGAHCYSAQAVAEGAADIAAIDALTWRMIRLWDDAAAELKELGRTEPTPALPWITAAGRDPAPIAAALAEALAGLPAGDRNLLGLLDVIRVPAERYLAVPNPPSPPAQSPLDAR